MSNSDLSENLIRLHQANNNYKHPTQLATATYSQPGIGQDHPSQPSSTGTLQILNFRIITLQFCLGSELPATGMGMGTSQGITGMKMATSQGTTGLPTSTTAAPAHSQGHEVMQFCPVAGCTYTSYPTKDPNMLSACLNQIPMHMRYTHDVSMAESGGGGSSNTNPNPDKSYREYQEATK